MEDANNIKTSSDRSSMVEDAIDSTNNVDRSHVFDADRSGIPGWGADLDPSNRPAVPMEHIPPRLDVPWRKPSMQPQDHEVLVSVEYPTMRPLFGTGPAPRGLSGILRRVAFRRSENDIRHWLMLIFADRVDMVEGILTDLAKGHIPNVFAEMGWKAKFKHDTGRAILKSLMIAGAVGYLGYRLFSKSEDEED